MKTSETSTKKSTHVHLHSPNIHAHLPIDTPRLSSAQYTYGQLRKDPTFQFSNWPFFTQFPEGIPFFTQISGRNYLPDLCEKAHPENCPSPSSVMCTSLYRTEHFSRGRQGRQGAKKRGGTGVASKGGQKGKTGV